jgi:diguanylate cyclase (GGDEF)-like protein/PAS domain S-box-containing protein
MNLRSFIWGQRSLQFRLHLLIQGSLILVLVAAQLWVMDRFESQAIAAAKARAVEVADGAINGLNTMMVTRVGDSEVIRDRAARSLFIQKMGASEHIKEMRIIRGHPIDAQFSQGMLQEQAVDGMDRQVLSTGLPAFQLGVGAGNDATFRAVLPFVASKNYRTTNCLKCHDIENGGVLGAASVTIDVTEDWSAMKKTNAQIWMGQLLLQWVLYFVIGTIVSRLAKQLGGDPSHVIDIVNQIAAGNLTQDIVTQPGDQTSLLAAVKQMQLQRKQAQDALEAKHVQLADIVSFLPDATLAIDKDRRVIIWNKAIEDMTGVPAAMMIGKGDCAYAVPFYGHARPQLVDLAFMNDKELVHQYPSIVKEGNSIVSEVFCSALNDNQGAWVFVKATPLHDQFGNVVGAIEVIRDISNFKRAEQGLRLAASVFTHAREGIVITDAKGIILEVNDTFSKITGYARDEVIGNNPRVLKSARQDRNFYINMWTSLTTMGHWHGEIWNRKKNGDVYAELLTISAVRNQSNVTQHYVGLFSDITHIKDHQRQLEHIAHYDGLTSLPNRMLLADRLIQAMLQCKRRGQSLAVVYLDLDGFKVINDTYGHAVGDQLLITLADRMKHGLREGDTLARIGGDEFVAVLCDLTDRSNSEQSIVRLLGAAANPLNIDGYTVQVTASLGVTFYPQCDEVDADLLLRQADQAMYQAKVAGKNRFHVFDPEQDRSVRGQHENLESIRHALTHGEFVLHYQPKVNMRTGVVIGAEALIRWQNPERGLLYPAEFLQFVEGTPLAIGLGEWVIDAALTQMEIWRQAGLSVPVAVNIGGHQLQQSDFVERLRAILARHLTVAPGALQLEILETSALEDINQVSVVINKCREFGVHFALDDFGTGYSSLTYLKRLPVSLLKIDQSFVRDMLHEPDDLSILQGVLGMAQAFGREVIAEGVETVEHGAMLLRLGCELAQGYGIAKPMPGSEMLAWSNAWRPYPSWLNLKSVNTNDLPLIFAGVEHRASASTLERNIQEGRRDLSAPAHNQCRFGAWMETFGHERYSASPAFQAVDQLHKAMHALGREICAVQSDGKTQEALDGVRKLHALRLGMLEQLDLFTCEVEI